MKPFNKCCFVLQLETAAYILSAIGIVLCVLTLILSSLVFEEVVDLNIPEPVLICQIVWSAIGLICFVLMAVGIIKKKTCFLIPYLAFHLASLIIEVILFLTFISIPIKDYLSAAQYSFGFIVFLTLDIYIQVCIYSLYIKMKIEKLSDGSYKQFVT